jgi:hypothetical protein
MTAQVRSLWARQNVALVVVAALAALFAVAGCTGTAPPTNTVPADVILYDAANYSGNTTVISSSTPDLSRVGWSGRISSLRIQGGLSIAVYSQPNYTGTCDTFVGHDPDLGNDRIGDQRIASIRLFHNCSGIVADPVVVDIRAVTGETDQIQCPAGYVKRDTNLNEGTAGEVIYLCLQYASRADAGDSAFTGLMEYVGWTRPTFACTNLELEPAPTPVPVDLNKGTGGELIYLCYFTKAQGHVLGVDGRPLRDVDFVVTDSTLDADHQLAVCATRFEDVEDFATSSATLDSNPVNAFDRDLNDSAGGKVIYACAMNYDLPLPIATPDLTPPAISFAGAAEPGAAGWNKPPVTLRWNCSDPGGVVAPQVTQTLLAEGKQQSATATCEDLAGNLASATQTDIDIDGTPPTIGFVDRTQPNKNGWNNTDVTVRWNCADALSGPVRAVEVESVTTDGANQSATGSCADLAGNTVSDPQTGINVDKTAPLLTGSVAPAPSASGWSSGAVTVHWTCDDGGGSGLDGDCPADSTVTGEGAGLSASQSISDRAGNQTTTSVPVNIDRTPPAISGPSLTPPAGASGWNNGDVTVTWACSDDLSGVPAPATSQLVTGEGDDLSATGTCEDRAGNPASETVTGIRIDRTAPVLTVWATTPDGTPYAPGTWTNKAVTVTFSCADELSGVATVTAPQTLRADGGDQHVDGVCEDNAGNRTEASFEHIDIDQTAPVLACGANPATLSPPDHTLVPVNVSVRATDDLSGPGPYSLLKVTSNEPDKGLGGADLPGDIQGFVVGTADLDGLLRAERSDTGAGRVYALTYRGTDAAGNAATCQATVTVPVKSP